MSVILMNVLTSGHTCTVCALAVPRDAITSATTSNDI